jgi:hypothetical protein
LFDHLRRRVDNGIGTERSDTGRQRANRLRDAAADRCLRSALNLVRCVVDIFVGAEKAVSRFRCAHSTSNAAGEERGNRCGARQASTERATGRLGVSLFWRGGARQRLRFFLRDLTVVRLQVRFLFRRRIRNIAIVWTQSHY